MDWKAKVNASADNRQLGQAGLWGSIYERGKRKHDRTTDKQAGYASNTQHREMLNNMDVQ